MIQSVLDTDFYKLTQLQFIESRYPNAVARYEFKCRNEGIDFSGVLNEIKNQISMLSDLAISEDELNYLYSLFPEYSLGDSYLKPTFISKLRNFRFNTDLLNIRIENNELRITAEGRWGDVMMFEIPVLSIVNECFFRSITKDSLSVRKEGQTRLRDGINWMYSQDNWDTFRFSEFGTRRRYSADWQREVLEMLICLCNKQLIGTSNVLLSKELNLKVIGTMAHELLQAYQALVPIRQFQKQFLLDWLDEFSGNLSIALTDTVGFDVFLQDFDMLLAKAYDGLRNDSGDPFEWGIKAIRHYKNLGIDPKTKLLLWSNGLDWKLANELHSDFISYVKTGFGIGTFLTNNVGFSPLNIVMKLVELNGMPTIKISDSSGKGMCENPFFEAYVKNLFGIK